MHKHLISKLENIYFIRNRKRVIQTNIPYLISFLRDYIACASVYKIKNRKEERNLAIETISRERIVRAALWTTHEDNATKRDEQERYGNGFLKGGGTAGEPRRKKSLEGKVIKVSPSFA